MTNNEIRAVLLKDYDWNIEESNELFPFVKLVFETSYLNKFYFIDLIKKLKSQNFTQNKFENGWQAFLFGFGKLGFAICFSSIFVFIVAQTIIEKNETRMYNRAYDNLLTDFINFNKKHSPQTLKSLEEDFNNAKETKLKIKIFPTDSSFGIGKGKPNLGKGVRNK